MRVRIIGGGLAGALLAWRLSDLVPDWRVEVVLTGRTGRVDATAASGGAVRAYEDDPGQRRLALDSLVELLGSPTLRRWADFRPSAATYLRRDRAGLDDAVAEIEHRLPGSARIADAAELAGLGWAGLAPGDVAVVERQAGQIAPGRLREAALADSRARCLESTLDVVATGNADLTVVAAGAWTPGLLRASGLPADSYRTKSLQYSVHPVEGTRPGQFVDGVTGVYGRPDGAYGLLLGVPTDAWDIDPDAPPTTPALADRARRLAGERFPGLRIGPARLRIGSVDCYHDEPGLALRPVGPPGHGVFTFTGGAGGSAKTALAASLRAATRLVESGRTAQPTPVERR
ncbi:FAD-dependent oxidoreductase [Longispora sp. NPDC051575]|uniref:FAD-dependent oxidoreductase n=1 Tax=Longispora sp. NPDC051575 TaxID=3154943 RepID=UPI0034292053